MKKQWMEHVLDMIESYSTEDIIVFLEKQHAQQSLLSNIKNKILNKFSDSQFLKIGIDKIDLQDFSIVLCRKIFQHERLDILEALFKKGYLTQDSKAYEYCVEMNEESFLQFLYNPIYKKTLNTIMFKRIVENTLAEDNEKYLRHITQHPQFDKDILNHELMRKAARYRSNKIIYSLLSAKYGKEVNIYDQTSSLLYPTQILYLAMETNNPDLVTYILTSPEMKTKHTFKEVYVAIHHFYFNDPTTTWPNFVVMNCDLPYSKEVKEVIAKEDKHSTFNQLIDNLFKTREFKKELSENLSEQPDIKQRKI